MGLDIPTLDDRTYAEIIEEARKRVPVYAPEWTDHNAHDPGITILEMLAWLAESYAYQLDRVTDAHREQYLRLLDTAPSGPRQATVSLSASVETPTTVESGAVLVAEVGPGHVERFEVAQEVTLTDAAISRVISEHPGGRTDNTDANLTEEIHFLAFGESARPGSVMYVGFDRDPFGGDDGSGDGPVETLDLAVDFYDTDLPGLSDHGGEESNFEPTVDLRWQYCVDYGQWYRTESWADLTVLEDGTNRLYHGGTIRFERPTSWTPSVWGVDEAGVLDQEPGQYWIRAIVRTTEGPETDATAASATASGSLDPGYEVPPQLSALRLNVVEARHGEQVTGPVWLTRSDAPGVTETDASPNQTFAFPSRPVQTTVGDGELSVVVGSEEWTRVDGFAASGPDDRHYVVDEAAGTVTFGDGNQGTVPEPELTVSASNVSYGGGEAGNVPASATWHFERDGLKEVAVSAEGSAVGGRAAESVAEAFDRLREDLTRRYRAVTAADYETIATSTPGLRFGRARAWVETQPSVGDCAGGRVVRVVVVPHSTLTRPEPSAGFLAAVRRHLCEHRLLTDRVTVDPPTYVGVGVDVEVRVLPGASPTGRAAAVADELDSFLDPLEGFDGDGWPFGRPVYPSELYEVVEGVEGVDCVLDVSVATTGAGVTVDADGTVHIDPTALVYPTDHDVTIRTDRDACAGGV